MSVALYAGSFDPVHLGHLGIIERAAAMHQRVVVAVLANPDKRGGMFGPEERVELMEKATRHLANVRSLHFHGLTVDLARRVDATVLVRSAHKERHNELSMAAMNFRVARIPTLFIAADPETRTVSSSAVRRLLDAGEVESAQKLVPASVRAALTAAR